MIDNFMGDETKELTLMEKESNDSQFVTNLITIKGCDHAFRGGLNRDENENTRDQTSLKYFLYRVSVQAHLVRSYVVMHV